MVREVILEEQIIEQRSGGQEELVRLRGREGAPLRSVPGRGNRKCQDPLTGRSKACGEEGERAARTAWQALWAIRSVQCS